MNREILRVLAVSALAALAAACSWTPPRIEATHIPPARYAAQACEQITRQMNARAKRANELYQGFMERRKSNSWKTAAAIFIFSPFLLLLEGEDEDAMEEYAGLKGEYEALRINAGQKSCAVTSTLLEEQMVTDAEEDAAP